MSDKAGTATAIEFIGVDKRFGQPGSPSEVLAARDVNFSVAVGEVVVVEVGNAVEVGV
jgi:hypothetical protein